MPAYDPTGHPLLSDEADGLTSDELREQASVAEDVLGLVGTSFSSTDAERAERAVAIQVNFQLATEGGAGIESESKGDQSISWRATGAGRAVAIHPRAERIAASLLTEETWPVARSHR